MHPHHLALVSGAAADVGERLDLPGGRICRRCKRLRSRSGAGQRRFSARDTTGPLGGCADRHTRFGDAISFRSVPDGHPDRRPVVSRQRRELRVPRMHAPRLRWNLDVRDQLVAFNRRLVVADEQVGKVNPAFAAAARRAHARAKGQENRRQIHVRITVGEVSAERRHVPDSHVRQRPQRAMHHRNHRGDLRRPFELRQRRHRANGETAAAVSAHAAQCAVQPAKADQPHGLEQARLHHQHQRRSSGDRPHPGVFRIEEGNGLLDGCRLDQLEMLHVDDSAPPRSISAFRLSPNWRAILALVARRTGWPRLPSLPVSPTWVA